MFNNILKVGCKALKERQRVEGLKSLVDSLKQHPYACSPVYVKLMEQANNLIKRSEEMDHDKGECKGTEISP